MLATLIHIGFPLSVCCNVFALGLESSPRDVIFLLRRPSLLLRSLLAMYGLMVGFAVAVATFGHLGRTINTVLVILSLSPVPPALPINNRKAGGSQSYAIGLLVTAVLVALFLVPVWVELLGRYFRIDAHIAPGKIAPVIIVTVLGPVFSGILLRRLAPRLAARLVKPFARGSGIILVAVLIPALVAAAVPLWHMESNHLLAALAGFVLTGLAVGHVMGGPDPQEQTILALATCARHPGVALAIIGAVFPELRPAATAVVIWYLLFVLLFAVPYVIWRRRTLPQS